MSDEAAYAAAVVARLRNAFEPEADRTRASGAAAYMRGQFPFLGLRTPVRRRLAKHALRDLLPPTQGQLAAVARSLWREPEREFQHTGADYLRAHSGVAGAAFVDDLHHLVTTKSWWDTVDALAAHTAGPLVRRHPELAGVMDDWVDDADIWVARTALLHQLTFGRDTDAERLFDYCRRRSTDREFFLRKAIGWALRSYARHAPEAVADFVDSTPALSGLSRREALKGVTRAGATPTPSERGSGPTRGARPTGPALAGGSRPPTSR